MRTTPEPGQHSSPIAAIPRRSRRTTKIVLGVAVTGALVASGVAVATANAAETVVPGRLQAESYAAQSGAQVESTGDADGGENVGWLADGDWLRFDGVDLGAAGPLTIGARLASQNTAGGSVELRVGTQTGAVLATIPVASTGGWQTWVTKTATATTHPTGAQTVFAVLKSAQGGDFVNLNWFTFGAAGGTATPTPGATTATAAPSASASGAPTTAAPTTAAPTTAAPTVPPASGNGWVPVDKAKWDAQLAEYRALKATAPPAGKVHDVSEFHAACTVSHHAPDDPIVFPGLAGASHGHTFLGNSSTAANSTNESLMTNLASSCKPLDDHSAYWVPTLLQGGKTLDPDGVTVYYGSDVKDRGSVVPFPVGFRMIAGDAKRQLDNSTGQVVNQFWCGGGEGRIGYSDDGNWPICGKGANMVFQLGFPQCWDGVHIDSPDHKSHVGDRDREGNCSGAFPVAIPALSFVIGYPTQGSSAGFALTSGKPSSMHGDFMNAWETRAQSQRVRDCLTQTYKCNAEGKL